MREAVDLGPSAASARSFLLMPTDRDEKNEESLIGGRPQCRQPSLSNTVLKLHPAIPRRLCPSTGTRSSQLWARHTSPTGASAVPRIVGMDLADPADIFAETKQLSALPLGGETAPASGRVKGRPCPLRQLWRRASDDSNIRRPCSSCVSQQAVPRRSCGTSQHRPQELSLRAAPAASHLALSFCPRIVRDGRR